MTDAATAIPWATNTGTEGGPTRWDVLWRVAASASSAARREEIIEPWNEYRSYLDDLLSEQALAAYESRLREEFAERLRTTFAIIQEFSRREDERSSWHSLSGHRAYVVIGHTDLVLRALRSSRSDFRTAGSLARETGISKERVEKILARLGNRARVCLVADAEGNRLYATRGGGPRLREVLAFCRAVLARSVT